MKSNFSGYYKTPTISGDLIVFVSDDDLWLVSAQGGIPRRLTSSLGHAFRPYLSPNGEWLAYIGTDDGYPELYVMPAMGGEAKRLTRLTSVVLVLGWSRDSSTIYFGSPAGQPHNRLFFAHGISREGGIPKKLNTGPVTSLSCGEGNKTVIGVGASMDPAWWKRYRGGRMGVLWIDNDGSGIFKKLIELDGNMSNPMWIGERIYFQSDHEGIGNLYSCLPSGEDLKRHTAHREFYLRAPSTDGKKIVYYAGGDIYVFDPVSNKSNLVEIDFRSPRSQRIRKFIPPENFIQDYDLSPDENFLCMIIRGRPVTMECWEGAVIQHGVPDGATRYRLARWLNDGKRIVLISDQGGDEALEIHHINGETDPKRLDGLDIGRAMNLKVSPVRDEVIISNNRYELIRVNLETRDIKLIDRSPCYFIMGYNYSSDGRWVAYSYAFSGNTKSAVIKICNLETGQIEEITEPFFRDISPCFDPEGRYLYYISYSAFEPVPDQLDFNYGFPRGTELKLITLQKETPSPLLVSSDNTQEDKTQKTKKETDNIKEIDNIKEQKKEDTKKEEKKIQIDLEGIATRVITLPVPAGNYRSIQAIPGKVFYISSPIESPTGREWLSTTPKSNATLNVFELKTKQHEIWIGNITSYDLSAKGKKIVYRSKDQMRVVPTDKKPEKEVHEAPSRKSGWIDLKRIKVSVDPISEWKQIFRESWRLLRDQYYIGDMGGCDWDKVYKRYAPLVDRISTRRELSDLIWEMGGELGTSHCYELGGDYPPSPRYLQGFLGADFVFDEKEGVYRVTHIVDGDSGREDCDSVLRGPGINLKPGDIIIAINGRKLSIENPTEELLINQGGREVNLTVKHGNDVVRNILVKAIKDETQARYCEWVKNNRKKVHSETGGRVGYIHFSDMGPQGFSEFHRAFQIEAEKDGLIIDIRFNAGGHIAPLILDRLMRKCIGFRISRWEKLACTPPYAIKGPIVVLTNEFAGSNADIFSHDFKQLKIGTLIGKRTWGGVVGLSPQHSLVDGGITTQPEFYYWCNDIGFDLENKGAIPDIEVDITPQDYVQGKDPQLTKTIEVILQQLETYPPLLMPDLKKRPDRSLPELSC